MDNIEGGIIQNSFAFPRLPPRVAIVGIWSAFEWVPGPEIPVQQFRNGVVVGFWNLVGIEIMSRVSRNVLLILKRANPLSEKSDSAAIRLGDFIVLGKGGNYSEFLLEATNLTLKRDCAIELEVGKYRYKGVALYEQGRFSKFIVFHPKAVKLSPSKDCLIWWRGKKFSVQIKNMNKYGQNICSMQTHKIEIEWSSRRPVFSAWPVLSQAA